MSATCGCCGQVNSKLVDTKNAYCRDHYVECLHTPGFGPNGTDDFDSDDPEYMAYVALLEAQWDALPTDR